MPSSSSQGAAYAASLRGRAVSGAVVGTSTDRLLDQVAAVVQAGNCSGCGACALLDPRLEMRLDADGYNRPQVRSSGGTGEAVAGAAELFAAACPGSRVTAPRPPGSRRHPLLGPVVQAWEAWAADPAIRHWGSSGGVLTALTAWLAETGEAAQVVAAAPATVPARTETVTITDRTGALAAAGSRYAPVSNAAHPAATDPAGAFVGKPCEVSALRALADRQRQPAPLLMSFFCAGVPSQNATDALVTELGIPPEEALSELRYRGGGWPGRFTAVSVDGHEVSTGYDESWGQHLGPTTQWRCKICPDGVGESSDLAAGDLWRVDDRGYPDFTEGDGMSVLIARTARGRDVVERAVAAGVLTVRPVDLPHVVTAQPLQVARRTTLFARLLGARAAGRPVPRYRGFGLFALAVRVPRTALRTGRGTFARSRHWRRGIVPVPLAAGDEAT